MIILGPRRSRGRDKAGCRCIDRPESAPPRQAPRRRRVVVLGKLLGPLQQSVSPGRYGFLILLRLRLSE